MKRKLVQLVILVVLLSLVTGCWNRRELNVLGIAVGIGIDKVGKLYQVTAQVVDPGEVAAKKGAGGRTAVTVYRAVGTSISEALRKMTTESPRQIYSAHLRVLVLGESLAREGIGKALDYLSRGHEFRTDFFIVVAKGTTAENTLKVLTILEDIPSVKMWAALNTSEKVWAPTVSITLDELMSDLVSEGKNPALAGIEVRGNQQTGESKTNLEAPDPGARLRYSGIAMFKKDKLVGWLNEDESKGFTNITDRLDSTITQVACPKGGILGIDVIRSKTNVQGRVVRGQPKVEVFIRTEANIGNVECEIDLTKSKTIYQLESKVEKAMKENTEAAIKKAKKLKTDIFGFGEDVRRGNPAAWKTLKKNWDEAFINLPVSIKIDVKIRRLGTVSNSFLKEMQK